MMRVVHYLSFVFCVLCFVFCVLSLVAVLKFACKICVRSVFPFSVYGMLVSYRQYRIEPEGSFLQNLQSYWYQCCLREAQSNARTGVMKLQY